MIYAGFEIEVENPRFPFSENIHKLIDNTTHITGWKNEYSILEYHGSREYNSLGKWGVEHDSSLFSGAEFVMPPMEKDEALDILEKFLSYIDGSGCHTLDSCGLHLNISADNMTVSGMDKSYFLSNINQRLLYSFWKHRLKGTNAYCVPMQKIIANMSVTSDLDMEIQNQMLIGRYRYVNKKATNTLERLEIRAMGGLGYHRKIKEIRATTNMFCDILEKSYEKTQPRTKKKIISYINRIQKRKPDHYTLWIPNKSIMLKEKALFYLLNSIKTTLEKENCPIILDNMLHRRYYCSYNVRKTVWEAYCLSISRYIAEYIKCRKPNIYFIKKITQKTNEIYYYIFKYLNKNHHDISKIMFDRFLSGSMSFIDDFKIILTVPKDEKSADVLWLCKYFEKLSEEAKKCFVNSLSLSALRFIKKKKYLL